MTEIKKKYLQAATEALTEAGEKLTTASTATKEARESLRFAKERLDKAEQKEKEAASEVEQARKRYDFAATDLLGCSPQIEPNFKSTFTKLFELHPGASAITIKSIGEDFLSKAS